MTNPNINQFEPSIDHRVTELFELSELFSEFMSVERATYRDGRPETDGEHTLHTMFLAMAYTAKYHPEMDPSEVALLLMVHDLDEVYVGDVNSLIANDDAMAAKEAAEEVSRQQLRQKLVKHPFILDLLERYWRQDDPVAQFARSFEKIDPSFAHIRDNGEAIKAMEVISDRGAYKVLNERAIGRMADYATPDVVALRRVMGERVLDVVFPV
jgi:5'-deoxynucleotidase YfbR-like HD superfamily hydrolase